MGETYDAIIIGAGIIGSALGFELAKKGYKTLNLDKLPAAGYGSTGNSCAVVRLHYSTWDGTAMAWESHHYWKEWQNYIQTEDERGLIRYLQKGCLLIASEHYDVSAYFRHFSDLGIEVEKWDLPTLKEKMPIFSDDSVWPPRLPDDEKFWDPPAGKITGAFYYPTAGYINDPQLASHNLQRTAEARGGTFRFNQEVAQVRKADNRIVGVTLKGGEEIDAPVVINAAGPHSFIVNRLAGVEDSLKIKTRALRREVHFVPSPPGFNFEHDGIITADEEIGCYCRQEVGNTILVGSMDPECDPKVWIENPDNYKKEVTMERWKAQIYRFAKRVPTLGIPQKPVGIVDLYDVSDDWIPIYDKTDVDGYYVAIGTSGNQFKMAPMVGQLMAELIDACENGHDHDQDPVVIKGRYTGVKLNAGFYSRLRELSTESSYTVVG
jgi:sarcosine oxidase subunit beta